MTINIPAALHLKFEAIREGELAKGLARLGDAPSETRAAIETLSVAIVNHILHATTAKVRESPEERGSPWATVLAELFDLKGSAPGIRE